ncbi:tetratricopeptide repeat protein [Bradyrhizobium sp. Ec3.3]|uniref:tetratricopeptide repeat protein n=1 Tax=Bradyrhizobium sp. Ec3.3 TaxID=189753 RepID=UPI0012EC0D51|nr:tetratricopeptide repeat protein [Bradyrhizobium sp. Ec3.3]
MSVAPLFQRVVIGAAESSLDVAGSALLPGAWPIVKGALTPVLDRLKQRFGGQDVTASKQLATEAASLFERDEHLQELFRTNLLAALDPVVRGQREISQDVEKLMLIALGNTRALEDLLGGVTRIEEVLAGGVSLKPDDMEKLAVTVARYVKANDQTRAIAQQEMREVAGELIKRQAARIEARAVELIREHKLERAADEVREGLVLVSVLLNEAPSDANVKVLLGYFYKAMAQIFSETDNKLEAGLYLDRASEVFELVKDVIPADKKTIDNVASAINGLGDVYYGRGEFERAIDNFRIATTLAPTYANAWHDMFGAYVGLACAGKINLKEMRHALQKTKETGQGIPGLDAGYIAQLEDTLRGWEQQVEQP